MHTTMHLIIFPLLLLSRTAHTHPYPLESVPASGEVHEDTGQVNINDSPTANTTETQLPVTATIFSGVPGPYHCRGSAILSLFISPNDTTAGEKCIDTPRSVGCGVFVANQRDGCQARLFSEPGCRIYANTVVFLPEERAVGGMWRSLGVRCGIPEPDPESLGEPPLQGVLGGKKGG